MVERICGVKWPADPQTGPIPRIMPKPRYFSMPSIDEGRRFSGTAREIAALRSPKPGAGIWHSLAIGALDDEATARREKILEGRFCLFLRNFSSVT